MSGRPTALPVPRAQRVYVIAMGAIIGGAFAYAACDWGTWTHLAYLPLQGGFAMGARFGGIAMHYYGLVLWGLGGLAVGAGLGAIAGAVWPRPWPQTALRVLGAWAIAAVLLAGSYFTWSLWPW